MPLNPYIYTFEASFFGPSGIEKNHFSINDYCNLGIDVMRALTFCVKGEISTGNCLKF